SLAAMDGACADGRLTGAERAKGQARLQAVLERFPADARPNAASAWRDGDEALLDDAARRGIVALGSLPRLQPGGEVVLVAAETVRASAASQVTTRPVDALARALEQRGMRVRRVGLGDAGDRDASGQDAADQAAAAQAAAAGGTPHRDLGPIATTSTTAAIVFASTSRTPIGDAEVAVAWRAQQAAERSGVPFVHVALWNPYSAARLPGPALLAFGFGARSAAAAVDALMGARVLGKAPAAITPATSTSVG